MMKKEYQAPQSTVVVVAYARNLLNETSTEVIPGGGSGTPDSSRRIFDNWRSGEDID